MEIDGGHMVESRTQFTDVVIIGAGMSGMTAASALTQAGRSVTVMDKGNSVGGRMASRRIGDAVFDHGAQFITARSEQFSDKIQQWRGQGIVSEWCRGFSATADGHSRWRGDPDMTALPKQLAEGVEVLLNTRIASISLEGSHWSVVLDDGSSISSAAVLLTAPVPQSLALLDAGNFAMSVGLRAQLEAISYERCLAVLAVLDGPSGMTQPGGMAFEDGSISWLADNQLKGVSLVPCVTLHASHAFSVEHWNEECGDVGRTLLKAAAPWIRAEVKDFQTHGWLFSKPLRVYEAPCALVHSRPALVMAGDAFAGPKVEGAACSGWAAAECLLDQLALSS